MTKTRPARGAAGAARAGRGRRPPRRRALEIERTREDILQAAARALARSGHRSVSMREIADEVGFTAPALYAYFDSKEAIFAELARTLFRELEATFAYEPDRSVPFRQRLTAFMRHQLSWADRRRDVFLALSALRMRGERLPPALAREAKAAGRPVGPARHLDLLAGWLARAIDRPADLGGHDPGLAATLLFGIGHGFFLRWVTSATDHHLADQVDQLIEFYFCGLTGAPPEPPRPRRGGSRR